MRLPALILTITLTALVAAATTSGLWWLAVGGGSAPSVQVLVLRPHPPAAAAGPAAPADPPSAAAAPAAPAALAARIPTTTAEWALTASVEPAASAPAAETSSQRGGADEDGAPAVQRASTVVVAVPAVPPAVVPADARSQADGDAPTAALPSPGGAAGGAPGGADGPADAPAVPAAPASALAQAIVIPPGWYQIYGGISAAQQPLLPGYGQRYHLDPAELLAVCIIAQDLHQPLLEVLEALAGPCGGSLDQLVGYYHLSPQAFFIVLEPGCVPVGLLQQPYAWLTGGCVGPTGFSNQQWLAILILQMTVGGEHRPLRPILRALGAGTPAAAILAEQPPLPTHPAAPRPTGREHGPEERPVSADGEAVAAAAPETFPVRQQPEQRGAEQAAAPAAEEPVRSAPAAEEPVRSAPPMASHPPLASPAHAAPEPALPGAAVGAGPIQH